MLEGVCGGLRKKSVRACELGWGSDMLPKEEPLRLRAALRRCEPKKQIVATDSNIPSTSPGKNPTSTAPAGNLLQCSVSVVLPFAGREEVVVRVVEGTEGDGVGDFVAEVPLELELEPDEAPGAML